MSDFKMKRYRFLVTQVNGRNFIFEDRKMRAASELVYHTKCIDITSTFLNTHEGIGWSFGKYSLTELNMQHAAFFFFFLVYRYINETSQETGDTLAFITTVLYGNILNFCCQAKLHVNFSSALSWLFNLGQVNQSEPQVMYLRNCLETLYGHHNDDIYLYVKLRHREGNQYILLTYPSTPFISLRTGGAAHLIFTSMSMASSQPFPSPAPTLPQCPQNTFHRTGTQGMVLKAGWKILVVLI